MSAQLQMPAGVSEHCTIVVKGSNGREIIVTGGKEKGNRLVTNAYEQQQAMPNISASFNSE